MTVPLVGLVPAQAGTPRAGTGEDDPTTFTVGFLNEVDSFNPFLGIEAESFDMWALTYDSLTDYAMDDLTPVPSLATEWEQSEDGLQWTYTLRDDAVFSDGEPLTADDVAFTLNQVISGGPWGSTWGSSLRTATKATATDATTVVLDLERPSAVLPSLPIPIVPEHVWSGLDNAAMRAFANEPDDGPVVGSGPFRLVEGTAGGSIYRFEANPDYWGGAPHVDQLVFRVFKAEDPAVQALVKGEIDLVTDISALQVQALEGREGITAHSADSGGFDEIAFNAGAVDLETGEPMGTGNPVLTDPAFRYALGFAIDRDLLVERAYQGAGKPGSSLIPPSFSTFHWEPPADVAFSYDPERAAELLDEAGYTLGPDGKRLTPDGEPIGTLRLFARSESQTSVTVVDYVKEWFEAVGLEVEVSAFESNKLTNLIVEGDFDMFEWGWLVDPDPDSMLSYMTCDQRGGWSDSWWCNEEYDALYAEQNSATDPVARVEAVKRMQEIAYLEAPYLLTAYNATGEAVRSDRFACLQSQPDPGGVWVMQYGVHNYLNVRPVAQAGDCDGVTTALGADGSATSGGTEAEEESSSTPLFLGLGLLVLGGLAGVALLLRRRAGADDRE